MSYPKFLYHKSKSPTIVNDADEHAALGKGWEETPAAFEEGEDPEQQTSSKKAKK